MRTAIAKLALVYAGEFAYAYFGYAAFMYQQADETVFNMLAHTVKLALAGLTLIGWC